MYQRQVSFTQAIKMALDKYCCFTGRASRSEYWWWVLFTFVISVIVGAVFGDGTAGKIVSSLVGLAFLLPGLGLSVRRLHDTGKSGWWILIGLIPLVGAIILLIFFIKDSDPATNAYGPVPNLA